MVGFTPRPLYPEVRVLSIHRTGGWVIPRAGLKAVAKGKKAITAPASPYPSLYTD